MRAQRGAAAMTLAIFGAIVLGVGFYCYNVIPFYYYFYELQNQLDASVRAADVVTDVEIKKNIKRTIKELQIPVDPDSLLIERKDHFIRLQLKYREVFYVTFRGKDYDLQVFDFNAYSEGRF